MTTYQDPPLQSRRAVRASERAAAQVPPAYGAPAAPGEPLSYMTQNRPPLPGYEAPVSRGRRAAEPPVESAPQPGAPAFRIRDFRPPTDQGIAPEADPGAGFVDYHTQARSAVVPPASLADALARPAASAAPASPAGEPAPPAERTGAGQPTPVAEQTLTRRELRALREAQEAATRSDAPAPSFTLTSPEPGPAVSVSGAESAADPVAPVTPARGRRAAAAPDSFDSQPVGSEPSPATSLLGPALPVEPAPPIPAPWVEDAPSAPVAAAPAAPARPSGHWTAQAALEDETQMAASAPAPVGAAAFSRRVAGSAITTSALVLPSLPAQDITTGEVLMTGSYELPRSLSSIGAHPDRLDTSDIDHLLDPEDHQVVSTDSIPISAIRAVSSHTGSRSVIATAPPKGGRALTALIAAAAGMAVVVVTLLVVAIATNIF